MDILGVSIAAAACFLLVRYSLKKKDYKAEHKGAAEALFRAQSTTVSDSRFCFNVKTAQIIDDKEEVEEMKGVFLAYIRTIIARNESGEYFWFHFRTDSPAMFKHIDHGRARVLLKSKYISPSK